MKYQNTAFNSAAVLALGTGVTVVQTNLYAGIALLLAGVLLFLGKEVLKGKCQKEPTEPTTTP